jgi:hypothetical protein
MNEIKFSNFYKKLPTNTNGKIAVLMYATEIELGKQVGWFLDYDTTTIGGSNYQLPQVGRYILLLFLCEGTIFTTLRRSTPEKLRHYFTKVSQEFKVVVEV